MQDYKSIEGDIVHITFHSLETGFTVLDLQTQTENITVVGEMAGVGVGQRLTVYGDFTSHPSFGVQFKVNSFSVTLPSDVNAMYTYLASGAIKGIGPTTAKRITDAFLEDTFIVLNSQPEKLAKIKGLSFKKAVEIQNEFKKINAVQDAIAVLSSYDISASDAISLYTFYGETVVELVKANPYILCTAPLFFSFERVDEIAFSFSMEYDSKERIEGGILYVLRHNTLNGHTCVPKSKLVKTTQQFIAVEDEKIQSKIIELCDDNIIISELINDEEFIFLIELYTAEMISAQKIIQLLYTQVNEFSKFEEKIQNIQNQNDINYAPMQITALKTVLENNVCVITGGPGTGKTTLVKGVIELFESQGDRVLLCAPTGRAAKRLSEMSNRPAKTIHRLLGVERTGKNEIKFSKNKDNPLKCEVLIVDEFSMVDTILFSNLITAVKDNCRVILVGDYNQLPAVGAGNILKDLILSDIVPKVQLTEIFRQAAQSDIIVNAHAINNGLVPKAKTNNTDYYFISCDEMKIENTISQLITTRLPKAYGFNSQEDIQILSPSRKKKGGTQNLNLVLQEAINPKQDNKNQITVNGVVYRVGDKVMQIKNNYDIQYISKDLSEDTGVFNGDIGYIIGIDKFNRTIKVNIEERIYEYSQEEIPQLEHAWAVTVHKSQGCEFKAVILSIPDTAKELQYRNLLYTAFTRAKEFLVIVGSPEILQRMVQNDKKQLRYSAIRHFMKEYYNE